MKHLKLAAVAALVAALGGGLWLWWRHEAAYPSTDDAYLQANIVTIAAQISGKVVAVQVAENQPVAAGDVLFRLDAAPFELALDAAQAALDAAEQAAASYAAQLDAAQTSLQSAQSAAAAAAAQLARTKALFSRGDVAQAALDQSVAADAQAQALVDAASAQIAAARAAAAANADAATQAASQAALARIDLDHATVAAPVAGRVANIALRPGATVAAYAPVFAIVETGGWWVEANFKETDLPRIAPGQPVSVALDMLPGQVFSGEVASIGAASGATFALLPAQNATGNWVKVTQRFPVRIALDAPGDVLRAGASATATVDTTAAQSAAR